MTIIAQLLVKYPLGFVVGPNGTIEKVLFASSHLASVAGAYPVAPSDGGYFVADNAHERVVLDRSAPLIATDKKARLYQDFFTEVAIITAKFQEDNLELGRALRQLYIQFERKLTQ